MIVSGFDSRLGPNFLLHPGFICAGGEEGKDACKGNSLYSLSLFITPSVTRWRGQPPGVWHGRGVATGGDCQLGRGLRPEGRARGLCQVSGQRQLNIRPYRSPGDDIILYFRVSEYSDWIQEMILKNWFLIFFYVFICCYLDNKDCRIFSNLKFKNCTIVL